MESKLPGLILNLNLDDKAFNHSIGLSLAGIACSHAHSELRARAIARAEGHLRQARDLFFSVGAGKALRDRETRLEDARAESVAMTEELNEHRLQLTVAVQKNDAAAVSEMEATIRKAEQALTDHRKHTNMIRQEVAALRGPIESKLKSELAAARAEFRKAADVRRAAALVQLEDLAGDAIASVLESAFECEGEKELDRHVSVQRPGMIRNNFPLMRVLSCAGRSIAKAPRTTDDE